MAHNHICGFYFVEPGASGRKYLPQVELDVHASIIASISRTTLTQTFVNPTSAPLKEVRYTFPLYDGVSVVGFVCTVGGRTIRGVVKEKAMARAVYDAAVSRGETAGLLEQLPDASDVFTTTIGNIPANAQIKVDITYLGELKHDAQVDGIRFTIPTSIAPRYGSYPGELLRTNFNGSAGAIRITVDAEVPGGSHITKIQSPSHTISVSLGTTSAAPGAEPSFQRASATLALGKAELDDDFILQVVATNTGSPIAVLEEHPMAKTRALMTTLVPKFSLPPARPEVVFICDRSGSMGDGRKIPNLQAALRLFVKSLSIGTKFNICSFGSHFQFLWPRSQTYDQSSVETAMRDIDTFGSDFGGTEMYQPFVETFKRRYTDMDLEVFLLTDGEIWAPDQLFELINKNVAESNGAIRVFTLGIGTGTSHALIEGVARAGNGFSQAVTDNEEMSSKVVRMLKGALFPHIKDYSLEVKYDRAQEDEFEIIEKVLDGLVVSAPENEQPPTSESPKQPISLFNSSVQEDLQTKDRGKDASDRYSQLPALATPNLLQAPFDIPPLFPFNRTSVYLLLSEDTPRQTPKSVILRGTSAEGPLQLEIPVTILEQKGETIHQLAAKKAVHELEQGRGWIYHARTGSNELLKEKYDGLFQDMVEREGVRLGVKYQVGGKWCSFVAIDDHDENSSTSEQVQAELPRPFVDNAGPVFGGGLFATAAPPPAPVSVLNSVSGYAPALQAMRAPAVSAQYSFAHQQPQQQELQGGAKRQRRQLATKASRRTGPLVSGGALFGSSSVSPPPQRKQLATKASRRTGPLVSGGALFGSSSVSPPPPPTSIDKFQGLIVLQDFQGFWAWSNPLFRLMEWDENTIITTWHANEDVGQKIINANPIGNRNLLATACAVAWLRREKGDQRDAWELVVEKAITWMEGQIGALDLHISAEDVIQAAGWTV